MTDSSSSHSIALAGDGIASRAMALALARMGWASTIIAPKSQKLQGGIQLAPNGWAALTKLGLRDAVTPYALPLSMMRLLSLSMGHSLVHIPLNDRETRTPYTSVTRDGLAASLKSASQKTKLVTWQEGTISAVSRLDDHAVITLDDGQTQMADWLIGGDGVDGLCRRYVAADDHASPMGYTRKAFRLVLPAKQCPQSLIARASNVWLGDGGHFVHYPLASDDVNMVAVMPKAAAIDDLAQLLRQHPQGDFLADYVSQHRDQIHQQPLYALPQLDALQRRRVLVIGDAAHPMPPHLAQGAGQTLIDAAAMMTILNEMNIKPGDNLQPALTRWAAERNRQTRAIRLNAECAGKIFGLDGPLARLRNIGLATIGGRAMIKQLEEIWSP
jgi:2-polyprenyl-6-methoxyphenol hydroxylase-like FAD-dependent oxidoreductase